MVSQSLKKNFLFVLSSGVFVGLLNFASNIIFAREIGPGETGKYALLVSVVEIITLFLNFGFNQYVIKKPDDKRVIDTVFFLIVMQSLLITVLNIVVFLVIIGFFAERLQLNYTYFPSLLLQVFARVASFFTTYYYATHEAKFNYKQINNSRNISVVIAVIVGYLYGAFIAHSFNMFNVRDFVQNFLFLLLMIPKRTIAPNFRFHTPVFREIFNFSKKNLLLIIQERVIQRSDQLIVGMYFGNNVLGNYYTTKSLFDGFLAFLINPIQTVLYSYCLHSDFKDKLLAAIRRFVLPVSIVLLASVFILMKVDFAALLLWLFSSKYQFNNTVVVFFIVYSAFILMFEITKVYAVAIDQQRIPIKGRLLQICYFFCAIVVALHTADPIKGMAFIQFSSYMLCTMACYFMIFNFQSGRPFKYKKSV